MKTAYKMIGSLFVLFSIIVAVAQGQVHRQGSGSCQNLPIQENFDVKKYLGTWYDNQRYEVKAEYRGKCVRGTYMKGPEDGLLLGKLQFKRLNQSDDDEMTTSESFIKHHHNKFAYMIKGAKPGSVDFYEVLDTDYENWAAEYQCWKDPKDENSRYELAWILTRSSTPTDDAIENALRAFQDLNLSTSELQKTDQSCYAKDSRNSPSSDNNADKSTSAVAATEK